MNFATGSTNIICDAIWEKGPTIEKWKFIRRVIEEIAAAPNAFQDSFSVIYILQNNLDKILIAPHERSVQKVVESRIIRKSIFLILGPFSRIASHMVNVNQVARRSTTVVEVSNC